MTNQSSFKSAQEFIPGGVNSPVRAFKSVGGTPIFIKEALGPFITDIEDKQYIDYVGSWGPMILGHAHPFVVSAVQNAASKGLSYGAPTVLETELAALVCNMVPSLEQIRFMNSGTEATMTALRLARGYTQRNKIIKFNGCYHGHSDSLLVKAGSGVLTCGIPGSTGVPESIAMHTLIAEFNDLEQVEMLFKQYPEEIAAIIVEPVAGNMGCILPQEGFHASLYNLCEKYGALFIFDEVMTGFRVAKGGAQEKYGIKPHLSTFGKIIGGGLPVGALGGRRDIMQHLAPTGSVYQAGTLSGNPLAMAAGLAQLTYINNDLKFYEKISQKTERLTAGLMAVMKKNGIAFLAPHIGGMFGLFFTEQDQVQNFSEVNLCHENQFNAFFHAMLEKGVYFAPSAFESGFMSIAHTDEIIDETIKLADEVAYSLSKKWY